ncbi:MAG: hypothetical protein AAGC60_20370 [Acidobacteriota bacterium]
MTKTRRSRAQRGKKSKTTNRPAGSGRWRRLLASDATWAVGLALVAFLHRLAFLRSTRDRAWPFTIFYEGDAETYYRFARSVLAGVEYDSGIPFHPPGFAYVLARLHDVLGSGGSGAQVPHFQVKVLLAGLASVGVGLLYLLVRPYLGRVVAVAASLFVTWHFGLMVLAIAPVTEATYLTLLVLVLLLWTRGLEHPLAAPRDSESPRRLGLAVVAGALVGGLGGLLCLVRAEAALPVLLLWCIGAAPALRLALRERAAPAADRLRPLAPWAAMALAVVLALTPWTLRNADRMAEINVELAPRLGDERLPTFVPLTLYGPLNLALANHDRADGTFSREILDIGAQAGVLDLGIAQHRRAVLHGERMALVWIADEPLAFLRLVAAKWDLASDALRFGVTQWNWPSGLTGTRRPVDVFVPRAGGAATAWSWLVGLLALAGVVVAWRRDGAERRFVLLAAIPALTTLVTISAFFGYARQLLLLMPFLLVFVAVALEAGVRRLVQRRPGAAVLLPRRQLVALGLLGAVLLAVEWSGADDDRNFRASGTTLPGSSKLNPDLPIELEPLPE